MKLSRLAVRLGAILVASAARAQESKGTSTVINFDQEVPERAPTGFSIARTGGGAVGRWVVKAEKDAPSAPNVLAQVETDSTDYRFPVAVADSPWMKDGKVSVKCKPVSGSVDRACGLVFRYQDEDNYYLARANALEDNTRLYFVKAGQRREIASSSGKVATGVWHELVADAQDDHLQVFLDGKRIIDAHDKTFSGSGRAGVWTKADSVTYFDDVAITPR
jgi:hypothetical protein